MAEYYDCVSEAKLGYVDASINGSLGGLQSSASAPIYASLTPGADTDHTSIAGEFNPRAAPDSTLRANRGYDCRGPHEPGAAEPTLNPGSTGSVAPPRWWASAAAAAAASPNVGNTQSASFLQAEGAPADPHGHRFNNISNNPYLTSDAIPAAWQQQQHMQDWSRDAAGPYVPSVGTHDFAGERGAFHPVFPNQAQSNARVASYDYLPHMHTAVADGLRASPLRFTATPTHVSDSHGFRALEANGADINWAGSNQAQAGRLSVGKCQSMRALYEENAALRRALQSIRRTSGPSMIFDSSLSTLQSEHSLGELDRCIASDAAEGRALSMRERGRWAMQAAGDGSYPMWVGTPRRPPQWEPYRSHMQAGGTGITAGQHRRPARFSQWWDRDMTADQQPLYSYVGGGSFGGWTETDHEAMCWDDAQVECPGDRFGHEQFGSGMGRVRQGTSLKQLLGGEPEKWRREGKKAGGARRRNAVGVKQAQHGEEVEEGQCAMCGGRLRLHRSQYVQNGEGGSKSSRMAAGGLPLRLCPACHPRAAASLPHSTKSPSALPAPSNRNQIATAVLMACRPSTTSHHHQQDLVDSCTSTQVPSKKHLKARSGRHILDFCRHFVGLSTKQEPALPDHPPSPHNHQ
ncbi:hypothetical protein L7F22_002892 [Adiantum nelumboides]|nr:hypothetical protein [Adiantum nelumboides]